MTFESLTSTLILNPASVLSTGQWLWSSLVALIHPFIQLHCYNILIGFKFLVKEYSYSKKGVLGVRSAPSKLATILNPRE